MPARTLWANILKAQSETGIPYLVYKDAVNNKSNQKKELFVLQIFVLKLFRIF